MNYMIFDLEFNQSFNFGRETKNTPNLKCPFEIIHIGAVKLDEDLRTIGSFDRLIKPKLYPRIHPYVKKLTGITKAQLNVAVPFKAVYRELAEFVKDVEVLGTWGTSDIKELLRNMEYHKLNTSIIPRKYIDIQKHAGKYLKHPRGITISLGNAAEALNISSELKFHNAFNDAFYTAEVFKKISTRHICPETYHSADERKPGGEARQGAKFDAVKLMRYFEKTCDRKLTEEEQSMIKLAYKLGLKNQL